MFSLNKLAEEKNKIAILGLGASPGITNMLALKAMNELDKVSNVYTGWDISQQTRRRKFSIRTPMLPWSMVLNR